MTVGQRQLGLVVSEVQREIGFGEFESRTCPPLYCVVDRLFSEIVFHQTVSLMKKIYFLKN